MWVIAWSTAIQHASDSSVHPTHASGNTGFFATQIHLKLQFTNQTLTQLMLKVTIAFRSAERILHRIPNPAKILQTWWAGLQRAFLRTQNLILTQGKVHSNDQDSSDTISVIIALTIGDRAPAVTMIWTTTFSFLPWWEAPGGSYSCNWGKVSWRRFFTTRITVPPT